MPRDTDAPVIHSVPFFHPAFADVATTSLVNASATITWGDGTSSTTGTITPDPSGLGLYDVNGTHTYAQTGTYTVTIQVTDDSSNGSGTSTAQVADAPITAEGGTVSPTAGVSFAGVVATFTDADTTKTAGDFTATIKWGDNVSSTATIAADPSVANQFDVSGTHTYSESGAFNLTIDVKDVAGATANATGSANVADAPITGIAQTITPTAGAQFSGTVAAFSDPDLDAQATNFTATIEWGDGGTSSGTVSAAAGGGYDVSGTYTYEQYGTYPVTVFVTSSGGSTATVDSTANVADAPLTVATNSTPPEPTAGTEFDGAVADFTDANPYATAAQFTATITWGDGSSSTGTVSANDTGGFEVDGTHTYTTYGSDAVSVAITSQGGSTLTVNSTVTVADAPITAVGTTATVGQNQSYSGEIATFTDANPYATASQFTATINWGDGTTTSGTVTVDPQIYGQFDVSGSHTYTVPGSFPIFVTISDAGGQSASAQSSATVTSANAAQTIAAAGAAGSFNTAVSGSGDTNTASFDLGIGSLAVMAPTTNTGGSDGDSASPTPNTAVMTVSADPTVPTSLSYNSQTTISQSGAGWTLETIGVIYVRTVTGSSTSGSFTESLKLTITYFYHQASTETFGSWTQSLSYTENDTIVIIATAAGIYSVSGGVTSVSGQYSDSQTDSLWAMLVNTSMTAGSGSNKIGASNSFLSETDTDNDNYVETGTFHSGAAGSVVAGASTYGSQTTINYTAYASATTAAAGATLNTSATDTGYVTVTYTELDTFQINNGSLNDAGTFTLTQTGLDSPTFMGSSTSSAGTAIVTASQTTNSSLVVQGTIGQLGGIASSSGTFVLTAGENGQGSLYANGPVTGDGTTGTFILTSSATPTASLVFWGTVSNVGGAVSLSGSLTGTSQVQSSGTLTVTGTFVSGPTSGTFSMSTGGSSVSNGSQTGQITTVNNNTTASGTETTTTSGPSSFTTTMTGSISGNGNSGHFTASSGGTGHSKETDTASFVSTNGSFTANGNTNSQATENSSGTYSQWGTLTVSFSADGSNVQNTDHYTIGQQATSQVTTDVNASGTISASGPASNAQITQIVGTTSSATASDTGTTIVNTPNGSGGSTISTTNYIASQGQGATSTSTVVINLSQDGEMSSSSGTLNITVTANGSNSYSAGIGVVITAGSSSGSQPGATSVTFLGNIYSQGGSGTYTGSTQGSFNGSTSSGTFQSTQNSTSSWGLTVTGYTITTGPSGGTKSSYLQLTNVANTAQVQSSGSFDPSGTSGSFTVLQFGNNSFGETNGEAYTQNGGGGIALLPAGTFLLTESSNQGGSTVQGGGTGSYVYENWGTFTPSASSGTFWMAQTGSQTYRNTTNGVYAGWGTGINVAEGYITTQSPSSSYTYTNSGSYTSSGSSGNASLQINSSMLSISTATEPFATWSGSAAGGGTLWTKVSNYSSSSFNQATNYTPSTTSAAFSGTQNGNTYTGVSNYYTKSDGQGGAGTVTASSHSATDYSSTSSGTMIDGTTVTTISFQQTGTSGYTGSSVSSSQSPGLTFSASSIGGGGTTSSRSSKTTSTTSPTGSLVALYANFYSSLQTIATNSSTNSEVISNVNSGTTTAWSNGFNSGDSYDSTLTEGGYEAGSGSSITINATYVLAQALSGFLSRSNMNEQSYSASMNQTLTSSASTSYTTYSAAYGETGSISGIRGIAEPVMTSSEFNASATNVATNNSLSSSVLYTLSSGGQNSPTITLTQSLNSTYSGTLTTSLAATGTTSGGAANATVNGGSAGSFSSNYEVTYNGDGTQTIGTGSSTSNYTNTYSPSGATFAGSGSSSWTLTTIPGTVTSGSSAMTWSYSVSGLAPPTVTSVLGSIGVHGSGAGGNTSGPGGPGSSGAVGSSSSSPSSGTSTSGTPSSGSPSSSPSSSPGDAATNGGWLGMGKSFLQSASGALMSAGSLTMPWSSMASSAAMPSTPVGFSNANAVNGGGIDWGDLITRELGAFQFVVGAVEVTYGLQALFNPTPEPVLTRAAGAFLIWHGIDNMQTGWEIMRTGKPQTTTTVAGLTSLFEWLGHAPEQAQQFAITIDTFLGLGAFAKAARLVKPLTINCFPRNALVDTETGLRAIAGVEPGDRVWAYDFGSAQWRLAEVEFRHDSVYDGLLVTIEIEQGEVTSTAFHPFWVIEGRDLEDRTPVRHLEPREDRDLSLPGRWVNSHEVLANDIVFLRNIGPARVVGVTLCQARAPVCNLTIRALHTFCVGEARILVHNTSGTSGPAPRLGPRWTPREVTDPAFQSGCERVAAQIQKLIGGEIKTIMPKQGKFLPGFKGNHPRWYSHQVVVRNGRVYDAFTGHGGLTIAEYRALWEFPELIDFGF